MNSVDFLYLAAVLFSVLIVIESIRRTALSIIDRRRSEKLEDDEICQCQHAAAYHHADGCEKQVSYRTKRTPVGEDRLYHDEWTLVPCECVSYVGPNTMAAPELIQRSVTPKSR